MKKTTVRGRPSVTIRINNEVKNELDKQMKVGENYNSCIKRLLKEKGHLK